MGTDLSTNERDMALDVLTREIFSWREELNRLWGRVEKVLAFWAIVVGFAFGFGFQRDVPETCIVVPLAFIAVGFYVLTLMEYTMIVGGYVAALEARVNEIVGKTLLVWEQSVAPSYSRARLSLVWFAATAFLLSLGLAGYSLYRSYGTARTFFWINLFAVVISCCVAVPTLRRLYGWHGLVRREVLERLAGADSPVGRP